MSLLENRNLDAQESKLHGYLTVFGGFCIHLFCGNLYLWGNIQMYVITHLHDGPAGTIDHGDGAVKPTTAAMMMPILFWF